MSSIFKNEKLVHTVLEGEVSAIQQDRPGIKLNTKPRIVICIPVGAKEQRSIFETPDGTRWLASCARIPAVVPVQWVIAHQRMLMPLGISTMHLWQWGKLSGEARQIMTMQALKLVQDDGYVLYMDDDVITEQMSLYTMYNFMEQHPEIGAVTGVYSTRQEPTEPVLYKEHMKGPYWGLTIGPEAVPEEVFACGAGFMLVRVSAIRDMVEANPGKPIWADSKSEQIVDGEGVRFSNTWGHDIRFCALLKESGWPLYVDGRVELGHFDSIDQKEYKLPADSPPRKRGRGQALTTRRGSIALVMPTHNDLDYAARCAASFVANTRDLEPGVIAIDDASDDVTAESYAAWAKEAGIVHAEHFPNHAGMTRSWNRGLEIARKLGFEYAVCGNADTLFSPGWDIAIVKALLDHELVGPVTNASGYGCPEQNVAQYLFGHYTPDDDKDQIENVAAQIAAVPTITLPPAQTTFSSDGMHVSMPKLLNGFCLVAKVQTWFAGTFDGVNVFDPSKVNSENETELQARWAVGQGARFAVVPGSFVFHYRSVSRGDQHMCPGAFRSTAEVQS